MTLANWIVHYFFSNALFFFLTILSSKQSPEQNLTPKDCLMSRYKGGVDDWSRIRPFVY